MSGKAGSASPSGGAGLFGPVSSMKWRIAGGFSVVCLLFAISVSLSAWQEQRHREDLRELDRHSGIATLLQEAEAQAGISALLLQRYVIAGDETLVPEIQQHADAAVASLTNAVADGAPSNINEIAVTGAGLTEGAGRVTALRQTGDIENASIAMEEIVPIFRDFRLGLEEATATELEQVTALRDSADRAGSRALWLLLISGGAGLGLALFISMFIARSIFRPLSSLEATAIAASEGDLSARAPANGPSEFAHLGSVLNDMMLAVESRTQELSDAYDELKERNLQLTDARAQALTDPLTGLGNHRSFHNRIREQIEHCVEGSAVSLIIFDIDGFKHVNDSLGHLAGDELLRHLAALLEPAVPLANTYRYGGDEFAVILPGRDRRQATQIAEELRANISHLGTPNGQLLTVSLGVCTYPEMADSAEELVYRADMAMYWAKSTGKNRVGDWDGLVSRRSGGLAPEYVGDRSGKAQDAVASLVSALNAKDPTTRDHTERCSWYAAELAREMDLDEKESSILRMASLLHDIGKLVMPDEVLRKAGALSDDEWLLMRQHPSSAQHILSHMDSVADAVPAIVHHHERFDGTGYPHGLAGADIPLSSRILSVTDAFDAMTSDRPYRKAMRIEAALKELRDNAGTQFDPVVVDAFVRLIEQRGAHPLLSTSTDAATTTSPAI
jgi:diguanylate cyclase (GGDEF)-like protein